MRPAPTLTTAALPRRFTPSIRARRCAIAVWFATAVLLATCLPALCAAQEAPITYPVDGIVENSLTHQPIARALVEAASDAVLTDNQGRFELHLPAGFERLTIRRPGYEGQETGRPPVQESVNVSANTPPVTFLLTPAASITGHVTLSSGDEAAGLQFIFFRRQIEQGHPRWRSVENAVTDNDGTFHLATLAAPASYVVCLENSPDRDILPAPGEPVFGFPAACYPGGTDLNSAIAAPLAITPGQQAQIEVSIVRQRFYPVSIAVAGSTAARPPFVQIIDRSGRPANSSMGFNSRSGTWEFELPNGSYYAESRVWGDAPLYARLDFTVAGAPLSGITLVPAQIAPIPVEIQEEFTANPAPAFNGPVSFDRAGAVLRDMPPIGISLDPVDRPLDGPMGVNLRPESGSTDKFLLDPPQQGAYLLDVQTFGRQSYAASISSGSTDLLREPLVIEPGGNTQPIQIILRNDMGFLECTPKADTASTSDQVAGPDENAASSSPIPIYIISTGSGSHHMYFSYARADFSSPASLLPLPPGNYLVLAFEKEHEIDIDDADAMARLAAQGQTVTIQPGATLDLQVEPIRDGGGDSAQ
jgi:hypothetical protein